MMVFLYTCLIVLYKFIVRIAAPFSTKAANMLSGRKHQNPKPSPRNQKVVWVHCASLGEFEQGRPVIESLKNQHPELYIVLTFFSPSGYEIRKNYPLADQVLYIPWDLPAQVETFISCINPSLVILVKYEFWYHHLMALKARGIPVFSISSIFRPEQLYFKFYAGLFQEALKSIPQFFVQNKSSKELLASIGITSVQVTGDTRFDRVASLAMQSLQIPKVEQFKGNHPLMVCGSVWPQDMKILTPFINESTLKFVIAPHEISTEFIESILLGIKRGVQRFSRYTPDKPADILIIDNIGMLSTLYKYGEYAYVGGAFGNGLHNILEAACYGKPIFFGNRNYMKFKEARDLIELGGAFAIGSVEELKTTFGKLNDPDNYASIVVTQKKFIEENLGATDIITSACLKQLNLLPYDGR